MIKQLTSLAVTAGLILTAFQGNASAHEINYKVQSGDSLWKIAATNGVSVVELKSWNDISSDSILINQTLSLLPPHTHSISNTYTVKPGDRLVGIAKLTNLSVTELKILNKLRFDMIFPGQVLKLNSSTAAQSTPITNNVATTTVNNISSPLSVSKVDAVVLEAKKHMGTPYVWGGSTTSGFDCSGYLNFVFIQVGIVLPRTVATIWDEAKTVEQPKVGDLVFFETYTKGPSHAGIYLGNNKFIHAGSSTGVTISDLTSTYWKTRYLGAKTTF
jgi:peptidoglycan DL-endopeptidase LytE